MESLSSTNAHVYMETKVLLVAVSISAIAVIILTWTWRALNLVWLKPKRMEKCLREQGFGGKSYRILFGDLKEYSMMRSKALSQPMSFSHDIAHRVIPFVDQTIKTYGKNSFMWFGPKPRVHITDPEIIKTIFINISDFHKSDPLPLAKSFITGLVFYEGAKWAKHRKIITPAFHLEKLKHMLPAFYQSCSEMISEWEKVIPGDKPCELDVWPCLQNMTSDVISRTSFGSSYEEGKRIFQLIREQAEVAIQSVQSAYIPGWRFMPTKLNRRMKEIHGEIQALLRSLVNKREIAIKKGEAVSDDLLSRLLQSNYNEIKEQGNDNDLGMTMEEVIEECKLFYFAGQETTSVLLVWTMILLSKYQEWQGRARAEVLDVFGNNDPDFDGLGHLKVLTMILNEVLRLYPPIVIFTRKVNKETRLGNFSLPAGATVSLPALLIQHDTKLWGTDANEFKPERFSEGVSKATKNQISYFPFGWGPRICIGQNFSMMEAKMALAMILQRFSFELSPSYTHAPFTLITLQPQHGAHLILHKLSPT